MKVLRTLFLFLLFLSAGFGKDVSAVNILTGRLECDLIETQVLIKKYRATLTLYIEGDIGGGIPDSTFLVGVYPDYKYRQDVIELDVVSIIPDSLLIAANHYFKYVKIIYTTEFYSSGSNKYLRLTGCCRSTLSNLSEDQGISLCADIPYSKYEDRVTTEDAPVFVYRPLLPFLASLQETSNPGVSHTYRLCLPAGGGSIFDPRPYPAQKSDRMEYVNFPDNYSVERPFGKHIPHKLDSNSGILDVGAGLKAGIYVVPYQIIRTGNNFVDTIYREVIVYVGNYGLFVPSLTLKPIIRNQDNLLLNWEVNYADSFSRIDLMVQTDGGDWQELSTSVKPIGSYNHIMSTMDLYHYKLKAYHISGEIRYSNTESAWFVTGKDELSKEKAAFYPNPGKGYFYTDLAEITAVEITDIQGKNLGAVPVENGKLDLSILPDGVYVIRFESGEELFYQKVILRR